MWWGGGGGEQDSGTRLGFVEVKIEGEVLADIAGKHQGANIYNRRAAVVS